MESEKNSKKIKKRKLYEYEDTCENEPVQKRRKVSVNEIHCKLNTLLKKQNKNLTQENKLIKHYKKGLNLYKKESNKWKSKYMQLYSQLLVLTNTNMTNKDTNTNNSNKNKPIPLHSCNINFDDSSNINRNISNINKYKSKHNNSNNNIISSSCIMVNRSYKIRSKKSLYKEPNKSIQCVTNGTKKSDESNEVNGNNKNKRKEVNGNNKNKKQYYDRNDPKTWRKCNKGHGLIYYSRRDLKAVYGTYGVCDNIDCKSQLYTGGYHCNMCNWDICKKCWKDANVEDDDYIP